MIKNGNILIIEDDADDKEILEDVIVSLGNTNKIVWKMNGAEALSYLCESNEKNADYFLRYEHADYEWTGVKTTYRY